MTLARNLRRTNPSFAPVEELTFDVPPLTSVVPKSKVVLKNQGMSMRSDHLRTLRLVSADMVLDDYDYSAAEIARCALARFLVLPLNDQLRQLEHYRKEERRVLRNAKK